MFAMIHRHDILVCIGLLGMLQIFEWLHRAFRPGSEGLGRRLMIGDL
jgi:hypothetical protein